ncbi:MAG: hypothetical protein AAGG65_02120 [Pseudomonadota bacterium]
MSTTDCGDDNKIDASGLTWPESYLSLREKILSEWGIEGDIYFHRMLSGGKSGAQVYAVDLNSRDFAGQAILKFDKVDGGNQTNDREFRRHQKAVDAEPDFAARHIERLIHASFDADKVALISTIAGKGLEYVEPWSNCSFDQQLAIVTDLSTDLLESWNRTYTLSAGLRSPQELIRGWLQHRIQPESSRLFGLLSDECGIEADEPTFSFDGRWYPNPVAFAAGAHPIPDRTSLRAVMGNCHFDLHGLNVLVRTSTGGSPAYSLIDLAMYEGGNYLFFDHAYFEIAHLLKERNASDPAYWLTVLEHFREHRATSQMGSLRADDLGLIQLVSALRKGLYAWIDNREPNRLPYMESQYLLARVAAGLNFANKRIAVGSRRLALLYAAFYLKHYLRLQAIEWPRNGPLLLAEPGSRHGNGTANRTASAPTQRPNSTPAKVSADPISQNRHVVLPQHPTIAVLPFDYLGSDADREFVADGISVEIITQLSRIDWLNVIARSSTFTYKSNKGDPTIIGRDLGVNYVVDGTVTIVKGRLRITPQLLDATDGREIWTRRYTGVEDELFAVLDEISESVVGNVDTNLKRHQRQLAKRKHSVYGAWEVFQRAMALFMRRNLEDSEKAGGLLKQALEIDPTFSEAYSVLALLELRKLMFGSSEATSEVIDRALGFALDAVREDEGSSLAHSVLGRIYSLTGEHENALIEGQEAVELNPSFALGYFQLGMNLLWAGKAADALTAIDKSLRLSPRDPFVWVRDFAKGICYYFLGEFTKAEQHLARAEHGHFIAPLAYVFLALVLARQNRTDDARVPLDKAQRLSGDFNWELVKANFPSMAPDYWATAQEDAKKIGLLND